MSQKEAIEKIKRYINILSADGIEIHKAYLYGSYAKNEDNAHSDIDVLLISDYFDDEDVYKSARPWQYTGKVDYRIEPFSISLKRFLNDDISPIIQIVKKEGIEIPLNS